MRQTQQSPEGPPHENLRQRARELERKLEELTQIYESLQGDPTPPSPEQCGSRDTFRVKAEKRYS